MAYFFTLLLQLSAAGLIFSGLFSYGHDRLYMGVILFAIAPFIGKLLAYRSNPKVGKAEQYRAEKAAKKAAKKYRQKNREEIGHEYFKATFLFAGHIAHADGSICKSEIQYFNDCCIRLQLDKEQIIAAKDYFQQGSHPDFDIKTALHQFAKHCGDIEVLKQSFLQTQFSFAEANGQVIFAELHILETISQRLKAGVIYKNLLKEYQKDAKEYAEMLARQRIDEIRRERDIRREREETERLEREEREKLAKLTPAQRELRKAFAVLGIRATKDKSIIKRAYREQIKRNHPDYLLSQGYPEELLQQATERSVKINKAYRLLKKSLKFS